MSIPLDFLGIIVTKTKYCADIYIYITETEAIMICEDICLGLNRMQLQFYDF